MSKRLKNIVEEIQYLKKYTIEDVAKSIGYSRVHLSREMKKEDSELTPLLLEKYNDILNNSDKTRLQNETFQQKESEPTLIVQLLKTQNLLLEKLSNNIESKVSDTANVVKEIDSNLSSVMKGLVVLEEQVHSGREVMLESLSRLEGKEPNYHLKEADKRIAQKRSRKNIQGIQNA